MKPQFYRISNKKQYLYIIGSGVHSYDISHPQFKFIKDRWNQFLKETQKQNCVVLVEGGKRPVINDLKEAVSQSAEAGFITSLAVKSGVDVFSPEPDEVYEIQQLLKKFTKDQIMFYYFSRLVLQWFSAERPMEFTKYIQRYFNNYQALLGWKNYNFRVDYFIKLHDKIKKHKFDENICMVCFDRLGADTRKVQKASVKIRDGYIVKKIYEFWKSGKNIFIVYGGGHTKNWKKELQKLTNQI